MNIGGVMAIVVAYGFNHRQRLLRGGCIIQVHQWLAMHLLMQDGKVPANLLHVKRSGGVDRVRRFGDGAHPTSSRFRSAPSVERSPTNLAASGMPATTSFSRCARIC